MTNLKYNNNCIAHSLNEYDLQLLNDFINENIYKNEKYNFKNGKKRMPYWISHNKLIREGLITLVKEKLPPYKNPVRINKVTAKGCKVDSSNSKIKLPFNIDDFILFVFKETGEQLHYLKVYRQLNGNYEMTQELKIIISFFKKNKPNHD